MIGIRNPFPQIQQERTVSYGGSQMWSENHTLRQCGCGVVAAVDLLHYLERYHRNVAPSAAFGPANMAAYNQEIDAISRRYFTMIPHVGINGISLVVGMNRLFRDHGLPFRARWIFFGGKLWERITDMLEQDIPVILAVGPNFPALWQKNSLNFYVKRPDGTYQKATETKAHYVTVTGIDEEWMRVSSWGRQYYISRPEYVQYVKKHSSYLCSNIVQIQRI